MPRYRRILIFVLCLALGFGSTYLATSSMEIWSLQVGNEYYAYRYRDNFLGYQLGYKLDILDISTHEVKIQYEIGSLFHIDFESELIAHYNENYGGVGQQVLIRDLSSGITEYKISLPKVYWASGDLEWSPNGNYLAVAAREDGIIWDKQTDEQIYLDISAAKFSPNSSLVALASTSFRTNLSIYSLEDGINPVYGINSTNTTAVKDIAWSANGKYLAYTTWDGTFVLHNGKVMKLDDTASDCISWHPDKEVLAIGTRKGLVLVDMDTLSPTFQFEHLDIRYMEWANNAKLYMTNDDQLVIYDLENNSEDIQMVDIGILPFVVSIGIWISLFLLNSYLADHSLHHRIPKMFNRYWILYLLHFSNGFIAGHSFAMMTWGATFLYYALLLSSITYHSSANLSRLDHEDAEEIPYYGFSGGFIFGAGLTIVFSILIALSQPL